MAGKKKITGSLEVSGSIVSIEEPLVVETKNILWADLVALRDAGELIPGQQYRITDYTTTTVQENTRSAGHQFDIIVTADSVDKLNENARAVQHEIATDGELLSWFEHSDSKYPERYFYVDSVVIEGLTLYRWVSYEELNNGPSSQYLLTETREVGIGDVVWGYQKIDDSEEFHHLEYEEGDELQKIIINVGEGYMPGYDYFYNSKLEAWQLKYCLDNDTSRFAWADEVNGKGVIYRMIDEFNNDVPYDFKNIQFKRKITNGELDLDNGEETWIYTFTGISYGHFTLIDGTVLKASEYFTDEGSNLYKNNKIGIYEYKRFFEDGYDKIIQQLNNIVFIGRYDEEPYGEEGPAKLVLFSYDNVLGTQCYDMTFGRNCASNTFGNGCYANTFGYNCYSNTFGYNCYSNTFGYNCHSNTFGYNCYSNTFGDNCASNTFGNDCYNNTFGDYCYYNTLNNYYRYNSFGDNGSHNNFGNYCHSNNFGNYCHSNTFGNSCHYLQLSDNTFTPKRYIHVENGTQGASAANKFDLTDPAILNKNYQVTFKKSPSGKYLMLWATDTGTMTGKVKDSNTDTTWEDIV